MVFHRIKRNNNRAYHYLIEGFKFKGKLYQVQKYLGTTNISNQEIEELKEKHKDWFIEKVITKKAELSVEGYNSKLFSREQMLTLELIRFIYEQFQKGLNTIESEVLERDFDINYIHSTTATEGNTCTLSEVTRILEDSLSPKGRTLREVYEVRNFEDVLIYRKQYKKDLNRDFILKLHELAMRDIDKFTLGTFRRIEVAIRGSSFRPVPAIFIEEEIDKLIKWFQDNKKKMHPVELALRCHVRFEEIHPFTDGNGRVGREIFNFIVERAGYPSLNFDISKRDNSWMRWRPLIMEIIIILVNI